MLSSGIFFVSYKDMDAGDLKIVADAIISRIWRLEN